MRCPFCNTELPDDALFCSECGARQEIQPQAQLNYGEAQQQVPPYNGGAQQVPPYNGGAQQVPPKKKKTALIVTLIVLGALLMIGLVVGSIFIFTKKVLEPKKEEIVIEEYEEPEESMEDLDEIADYNLYEDSYLNLAGNIVYEKDVPKLVLDLPASFYGMDFAGEEVFIEDVKKITLYDFDLPVDMLKSIEKDERVILSGDAEIDGKSVNLYIWSVYDVYGEDLVEEFLNGEEDFIIPDSDVKYLTDSDIEGLDIREINYAKNEIYARHGRKFKSQELQEYFESKSWYFGFVEPEDFDNSFLTEIEIKNAEFLSKAEFAMNPEGYKLDAGKTTE